MLIMKFGGTSVGAGECIRQVARIICDHRDQQPVVVISAMSGVTDSLLVLARCAAAYDRVACTLQLDALQERHLAAARVIDATSNWTLLHQELAQLNRAVDALMQNIGYAKSPAMVADAIAAFGELLAVALVTGALQALGSPALACLEPVIVTNDRFGEATPQIEPTRAAALRLLKEAGQAIPVTPGFIGHTSDGRITTLGRGGSDYSATILAVALKSQACWIYTDVDGILSADPRIVPGATVLPRISAANASRLSYCGARVLHPRSVAPAARLGIELRVRNTFRPHGPGTVIEANSACLPELRGYPQVVAGRSHLSAVGLAGHGLSEIPNLFGRLAQAITAAGVEIIQSPHPLLGHDPQMIIESSDVMTLAPRLAMEFEREEQQGLFSSVVVRDELALCSLIGDDLESSVLGKAQHVLAGEQIRYLHQATCPDVLCFVIPESMLDCAVRRLHADIISAPWRTGTVPGSSNPLALASGL